MNGLYLVTDSRLIGERSLVDVVGAAVAGGVQMVQLREKTASTRDFITLGNALKQLLTPLNVPLIINDRVDVALVVGADGIHIGQSDMPYGDARRLMGDSAIIGLSVETMDDVIAAEQFDVDHLGVSPVFSTPTKTDTKGAWGVDGIAKIRQISRHPLVGIGGINASNVQDVIHAGASGAAVVSAICAAPDPETAARELCNAINEVQPLP